MTTLPSIQVITSAVAPSSALSVEEILHAFANVPNEDDIPVDALRAALAMPERMTPALLAVLDLSPDRILEIQDEHLEHDAEYYTHVCAMFLLAAYGETRAFARIVRFFHRHAETDGPLSGERAQHVTGDLVGMDLPLILAATYDGDCGPLLDMIADAACEEYVRADGVETLFQLAASGKLPRDEAIAYLGTLAARLPRSDEHGFFWLVFVEVAARFASGRLEPILRSLIEADWFDRQEMTWPDVVKISAMPWAEHVAKHYKPGRLTGLAEYLDESLGWFWQSDMAPGEAIGGKRDNTRANLDNHQADG